MVDEPPAAPPPAPEGDAPADLPESQPMVDPGVDAAPDPSAVARQPAVVASGVRGASSRAVLLRGPRRRPRVRRVTRVLRHIDPWSAFKVGALFSIQIMNQISVRMFDFEFHKIKVTFLKHSV